MSYETIAILMFSMMMLMLLTGQRVFGAIGFIAVVSAFFLWGDRGGYDLRLCSSNQTYEVVSTADIAHVYFYGLRSVRVERLLTTYTKCSTSGWEGLSGGLAVGTIGLDGFDICNERPFCCGYGDRCHDCFA